MFVLYLIISSVMRALGGQSRGQRKRTGPLAPPPVSPPPYDPFEDDVLEEGDGQKPVLHPAARTRRPVPAGGMVGAEDMTPYLPRREKSPESGRADRVDLLSKSARPRSSDRAQDPVVSDQIGRPSRRVSKKPKAKPRTDHLPDTRQELFDLVGSPKIAMGVVISEVLSAPRSKRPHRRGIR